MKVIKPVIQYTNIREFKEYLEEFAEKYPHAEDLKLIDYLKADGRVINDIELFLAPEIRGNLNLKEAKEFRIQTGINTNLDIEWFAKRKDLENRAYGELILTEDKDPSLVFLHPLIEISFKNQYKNSEKIISDNLNKSAYETNKTLDDLFNFYGISNFKEIPFIFDFQRMRKIRDKRIY